jgi:hypothetical protein
MPTSKPFTIEPCILVSDKLTVVRGVSYHRRDLDTTVHDDGSEDALWETQRHYKNREETKEADRVYAKARQRLRSVCLATAIGFVCPLPKRGELEAAMAEAKALVDDFNKSATWCHINYLVLCTDIAPDNVSGVALLRSTLQETTDAIRQSLREFDAKNARDTLYATKRLVDVLNDPAAREELRQAREEAGQLCKEITRLVKDFDGNAKNALASERGEKLMERVHAVWNF